MLGDIVDDSSSTTSCKMQTRMKKTKILLSLVVMLGLLGTGPANRCWSDSRRAYSAHMTSEKGCSNQANPCPKRSTKPCCPGFLCGINQISLFHATPFDPTNLTVVHRVIEQRSVSLPAPPHIDRGLPFERGPDLSHQSFFPQPSNLSPPPALT